MIDAAEFPGAWQHFPVEVRRYLLTQLLEKQLRIQDGPAGLVEWLYRGLQRDAFVGLKVAYRSGVIHYKATAKELWPIVVADAKAWAVRERKAAEGGA